MAYIKKTYRFASSNEYEYTYRGKYGAAGEKRARKKKVTPEQMRKQNQQNRANRVRRLIKANFSPRDYWVTLKFKAGERPTMEKVKEIYKKFLRNLRTKYKKFGEELKYIARLEIGGQGGIHLHIIINRIESNTDIFIRECWKKVGGYGVDYELLRESDDYAKLAEYIVKEPSEEQEQQLSFFEEEEQKELKNYMCSKNLTRPEPEHQVYSRWTVKRIIEDGPVPSKGYYIDKSSIVSGVNLYTGLSYLKYTEVRIENGRDRPESG